MTWLDKLTLDTVVVHTRDGMSFRGIKSSVYDDGIVLKDARLIENDGMSEVIIGLQFIPREQVHFMQIIEAEK